MYTDSANTGPYVQSPPKAFTYVFTPVPSITVTPAPPNVVSIGGASGSTGSFGLTATNTSWKITGVPNPSWFRLSQLNGTDTDDDITVTALYPNPSSTQPRAPVTLTIA